MGKGTFELGWVNPSAAIEHLGRLGGRVRGGPPLAQGRLEVVQAHVQGRVVRRRLRRRRRGRERGRLETRDCVAARTTRAAVATGRHAPEGGAPRGRVASVVAVVEEVRRVDVEDLDDAQKGAPFLRAKAFRLGRVDSEDPVRRRGRRADGHVRRLGREQALVQRLETLPELVVPRLLRELADLVADGREAIDEAWALAEGVAPRVQRREDAEALPVPNRVVLGGRADVAPRGRRKRALTFAKALSRVEKRWTRRGVLTLERWNGS